MTMCTTSRRIRSQPWLALCDKQTRAADTRAVKRIAMEQVMLVFSGLVNVLWLPLPF